MIPRGFARTGDDHTIGDTTRVGRPPAFARLVCGRSCRLSLNWQDVNRRYLNRPRSRGSLLHSAATCTKSRLRECTVGDMDVSVTELRAHLSEWLDRARAGREVVITDRGIPVARLTPLDSAGTLERLTAEGVIGKATAQRPVAAGRRGPRPRRPVSDRVSDQRR